MLGSNEPLVFASKRGMAACLLFGKDGFPNTPGL
jgi:hypothetical protein